MADEEPPQEIRRIVVRVDLRASELDALEEYAAQHRGSLAATVRGMVVYALTRQDDPALGAEVDASVSISRLRRVVGGQLGAAQRHGRPLSEFERHQIAQDAAAAEEKSGAADREPFDVP